MGSLAQEFPQVLLQVLHGDWGHGSCCPALWPLLGHTSVIWAGGTFRRMGGGAVSQHSYQTCFPILTPTADHLPLN